MTSSEIRPHEQKELDRSFDFCYLRALEAGGKLLKYDVSIRVKVRRNMKMIPCLIKDGEMRLPKTGDLYENYGFTTPDSPITWPDKADRNFTSQECFILKPIMIPESIVDLVHENDDLKKKLEAAECSIRDMRETINNYASQNVELKGDLNKCQAANIRLKGTADYWLKEYEIVRKEANTLHDKLEQIGKIV